MNRNKVTALITIFLTFLLFIIIPTDMNNPMALVKIASIVAVIVMALLFLYTRVLWKIQPFKAMHNVVDVSGKWEGELPISEDKKIPVEVKVKQYFDDVSVEVFTDHNYSESLVTQIVRDGASSKLFIVYKCKPSASKVESKDDIDYGTIIVRLDEDILEGEYYNSKSMHGKIELYRKD